MRNTFIRSLSQFAAKNRNIYLVTGDLGFSVLEDFRKRFPEQFINIGVAEQDMIGVSAGLALCGKTVFVYSIVPFAIFRPLEQIRDDICYQNLNVRIVGVGAGLTYGHLGSTHYGLEDIGVARSLPNMKIFVPADPVEAEAITRASLRIKGPLYIRLSKTGEPIIHRRKIDLKIGKSFIMRPGKGVTLFATGPVLHDVLEAAERLKTRRISARVLSMPWLKPIDRQAIIRAAKETRAIFTIEEHNIIGGLGSAVAEVLAESKFHPLFKRIGIPDVFPNVVGSQEYLKSRFGISAEKISDIVLKTIKV